MAEEGICQQPLVLNAKQYQHAKMLVEKNKSYDEQKNYSPKNQPRSDLGEAARR
jgi:hypothetical protein